MMVHYRIFQAHGSKSIMHWEHTISEDENDDDAKSSRICSLSCALIPKIKVEIIQ